MQAKSKLLLLIITCLTLTMLMIFPVAAIAETGGSTPQVSVNPFTDVQEDDWFYGAVMEVYTRDLFGGTSETTFSPNQFMTRGMFVTVLWRLDGKEVVETTYGKYSDVEAGAYYEQAVAWAEKNSIVSGAAKGIFAPNQNITREEMAAMLYRYIQYKGGGFIGAWAFPLKFKDSEAISQWAYEPICYLSMKEVIKGDNNNMFNPQGTATRGEVAQLFLNYFNSVK